jgi:AAA domain
MKTAVELPGEEQERPTGVEPAKKEAKPVKLLERVMSGRSPAPRRVMLYGTQGIGKSTFAAGAPRPVFIQTEDGLGEIDCDKFPVAASFDDAMRALSELYTEEHHYKTVVIDSLDWMERLIWAEVCRKKNVTSIEDIGYAKGYVFALTQWKELIEGLSALRSDRGMSVVLIAHARIERFENPETEAYDRYVPRLHKLAAAVVQEWCDEVLFATYKVYTRQTDEGFDRKRTQGLGTGERVIRTEERPAHVAKNRLGLPEELPLDWNAYAHYITNNKGEK